MDGFQKFGKKQIPIDGNASNIAQMVENTRANILNGTIVSVTIILGNESGDLDSVIGAFMLSMFYNWQKKIERKTSKLEDFVILPIVNITREDFATRTEVLKSLNKATLNPDSLICRDDIDLHYFLKDCKEASVVLVDHHVLSDHDKNIINYVTEIYDHRPISDPWPYKKHVKSVIEQVGSCCTLITKRIRDTDEADDFFQDFPMGASLLHQTIILDTINLCRKSKKATALDEKMVLYLETFLRYDNAFKTRKQVLNELLTARNDVSNLTLNQILKRDTKIVQNIIIPSIPLSVQQFIRKPDAEVALLHCLVETKCNLMVLLGIKMDNKKLSRDLLIFTLDHYVKEAAKLNSIFLTWSNPSLDLVSRDTKLPNAYLYIQKRTTVSRKNIIPIITEYINKRSIIPQKKKPSKSSRQGKRH